MGHIVTSTVAVALTTIFARLAGMGKELAIANQFGTGDVVDAFLIAFLIPSIFTGIIAGSFGPALVPSYIRSLQNGGKDLARDLASATLASAMVILFLMMIVLVLTVSIWMPLLTSGFGSAKQELTVRLFYEMSPLLFIRGLIMFWSDLVNAREKFFAPAMVPVITPTAILFCLWLWGGFLGIESLVVGVLVGGLLEVIIMASLARRVHLPLLPRWSGLNDEIRYIIHQYWPMIAGAFVLSGTTLVDQAMAAMLESGSVATLNYGNKISAMVMGVGGVAVGTVLLPHLSEFVASRNWSGLTVSIRKWTQLIIGLAVPVCLILILASEPIIRILFERGSFTSMDTVHVSQVQVFYALQIPLFIEGVLLARLHSSMGSNRILMYGAFLSFPLNIGLNYLLMQWMGVSGIALSTLFVYLLSAVFLGLIAVRNLRNITRKGIL